MRGMSAWWNLRFSGMTESIGPMQMWLTRGRTPPPVGRRPSPGKRRDGRSAPSLIVRDEFRPAILRSGCSPALPVSVSPAISSYEVDAKARTEYH